MAKFLKSFFQTDKKSSYEGSSEDDLPSPLESKRKLSVSRSGRMKQSQKKRLSLSLDIYGDSNYQMAEKPKSREYCVHPLSAPITRPSMNTPDTETPKKENQLILKPEIKRKSPEEEIDIAFEVIEKTTSSELARD